nr:MAG TPA: hypothetical protein [Caudoviricetes sp.]
MKIIFMASSNFLKIDLFSYLQDKYNILPGNTQATTSELLNFFLQQEKPGYKPDFPCVNSHR